MKTILCTGGTGYIGSHTAVQLLNAGYNVVLFDNLYNSKPEVVNRIEKITGKRPTFVQGDIRDRAALDKLFAGHDISAVIHFAGLKCVPESIERPMEYFENNVTGTLVLCEAMKAAGVKTIVFSSSATVYGTPQELPLKETSPLSPPLNPYGRSKLIVEQMLTDIATSDAEWRVCLLRYFNPVGAHESGLIGEDPMGIPNNLMPRVAAVATGRMDSLPICGNDWDTPDGTGVRDYIHVVDLADGHVQAVEYMTNHNGVKIFNLGTGNGYSVLDMVKAFEKASGREVKYSFAPRRPGDMASVYANCDYANNELHWQAKRNLENMVNDLWRWQSNNPNGYAD